MNDKIDVLAVLDWLVDKLPYEGEESANRFNEARAAIAELIEAAVLLEESLPDDNRLAARLRVALANVRGAK